MKISSTLVPKTIKKWVNEKLDHNTRKWSIDDSGTVNLGDGIPWHECCVEYFQMFRLCAEKSPFDDLYEKHGVNIKKNLDAEPVDFTFENSGANEYNAYKNRTYGKMEIPKGFVVVMCQTYPMRACIYTAKDSILKIEG